MKINTIKSIDCSEWDKVVVQTYGKPYHFQQQDGCQSRGVVSFTVPQTLPFDYPNETVEETLDTEEMGVSFDAWLKRDPNQPLEKESSKADWVVKLWWERNFYPNVEMVANDLYVRGLLEAGTYKIIIDW